MRADADADGADTGDDGGFANATKGASGEVSRRLSGRSSERKNPPINNSRRESSADVGGDGRAFMIGSRCARIGFSAACDQ